MDAISLMATMSTAKTQSGMQVAMMKQQVKADQAVLDMLSTATQSPPAPGTGLVVDKRA